MIWYDDYQRGVRAAWAAADARDADAEALAIAYGLTFDPDEWRCPVFRDPKFSDPEKRTVLRRCTDFRWRSCLGTFAEWSNDPRSWHTAREGLEALLGSRP